MDEAEVRAKAEQIEAFFKKIGVWYSRIDKHKESLDIISFEGVTLKATKGSGNRVHAARG